MSGEAIISATRAASLHDIIVIGASAGGHRALEALVAGLPADFPGALLVAMHLPPGRPSVLPEVLNRAGPVLAEFAVDGQIVAPNRIYIAPPDVHLLVDGGRMALRRGRHENGVRPAIDPLFRSAACAFASRTVGVLLTGLMSDGVSGLIAVKRCGGITVVQDPLDAEHPELPRNAIAGAPVDHVASVSGMGALLGRLLREPALGGAECPDDIRLEVRMSAQEDVGVDGPGRLGTRSILTCPDCNGALWEIADGKVQRYRCHIGHSYTLDSLALAQMSELERALSAALRSLQDRIHLVRKLAELARRQHQGPVSRHWENRIAEYERDADLIRGVLLQREPQEMGGPDPLQEPAQSA